MGDIEVNECGACGRLAAVIRTYYHYNIECTCCGGSQHFEIVYSCSSCNPEPPSNIKVNLDLNPVSKDLT